MEFVLKTKMTKTSIQRRLWRNFIQRGLVVPIFIHCRLLLFEGNASLKWVYSGLTPLSTVFESNHDGVWSLQGAQYGLLVPIFIHKIRDYPVLLFALNIPGLCKEESQYPSYSPAPQGQWQWLQMTGAFYLRDKPVLSVHLLASNWQLPYTKQQ